MRGLANMLNQRSIERGLTPDVSISHQTHIIDTRYVENSAANRLRIDTWLMYHRNQLIDFKKNQPFIKHPCGRLLCDIQGIIDELDGAKYKRVLGLFRNDLFLAVRNNVSDRIKTDCVHDAVFTKAYVDGKYYDTFLSDPTQYPKLLVMVTPQARRRFDMMLYPFAETIDPEPMYKIRSILDTAIENDPKHDVRGVLTKLTQVITTHFQTPEKLSITVLPVSLGVSIIDFNVPLLMQYCVRVLDADGNPVMLERRTAPDDYLTDISVNILSDANSA